MRLRPSHIPALLMRHRCSLGCATGVPGAVGPARPPRGCRALSNIAHGCDGAALLSGCVRVQACCQVVLHHLGGYYTTSEVV